MKNTRARSAVAPAAAPSASSPDLARISSETYPPTVPPTRVPQFNLDVVELDAYAKSLQPWRSKQRSGPEKSGRLPPLVLDVYVSDLGPDGEERGAEEEGEEKARERPRVLIERWVLRHDADDADAGLLGDDESSSNDRRRQNPSPSKPGRTSAETVAVAYKRTVVMVRALHALCRSLPANRCHRAARRSQCRGLRFAMSHEVRTAGTGGGVDSSDAAVVVEEEKPSGGGGDFGEYSFTPVRTPAGGSLRAVVYFLNADKLAGMDCVPKPTAPRVIDGYLGGGQKRSETAGGGGAHPMGPGPFLPSSHTSASPSPFSPTDAPAPPRRDFGFGTSPSSGGVSGRPFRANSWAGKATYGFGASPPARATLPAGGSPVTTGDGVPGGLPRAGSRGMLSEAIAEQKASEGGAGGVNAPSVAPSGGAATKGESVGRSSTKPPPSPPQIYGFGVGSLGTATNFGDKVPPSSPRYGIVGSPHGGSPSLPFASTSHPTRFTPLGSGGSGPRGGHHGFSTSLASGDHALARRAREFGRSPGDGQTLPGSRPQSARLNGGAIDDSPPWHFRGFTGALSASPGSTPGGGTTPRGSHGSHGGGSAGGAGHHQSNSGGGDRSNPIGVYYASPGRRPRRPSWSSPSSSLSASLSHGGDASGGAGGGGGIGSLVGGALSAPLGSSPGRLGFAYSHGTSVGGFNGAPHAYSYGASPGASPGGSFANAMAHLRAQRAGQGAGAGVAHATGIQRIPDSGHGAMFESGADSDQLPFALDDEDDGLGGFDHGGGGGASTGGGGGGGGGGGIGSSVDSPMDRQSREGSSFGSGVGGGASGRSDAAVGALVRMLQDAAPLSAEWGTETERVGGGPRGWGDAGGGASEIDSSRDASSEASGDAAGGVTAGGVGGEMTLDWALSQLSRFRDFKASLDESTSTLEAVEERPNGEEGGTE